MTEKRPRRSFPFSFFHLPLLPSSLRDLRVFRGKIKNPVNPVRKSGIMTNYIYKATSLDGFIADKHGGIDWLTEIPNPDKSDYGFAEFMDLIDAVVLGRKTFEQVLSFGQWPYTKPVFVVSSSLQKLPDHLAGKAEIIKGEPEEIVDQLHLMGFNDLYIDGGRTIQNFLQADLIDTMIITSIPVLLGEGISLFGSLDQRRWFRLKKSEVLEGVYVKSWFERVR
ncbi:MAG: dihydrofolate reductase family protein [bacterium]